MNPTDETAVPGEAPPQAGGSGGMGTLLANLLAAPRAFRDSVLRHGPPTSDRAKSQTVT
ncbi:MAG: hypothetical protein HY303_13375, partial [Candidatus Wallbacteria bacterium]|nr:hypothetical protein [Candidatus Wallbacteria bacterium]